MPGHGFQKGDPRAVIAGRKGGRTMRSKQTPDYILGYKAGARYVKRQEQQMADFVPITPFVRIAQRLHADQRRATTPEARHLASEAMAHFLRMASVGRLDDWIASHPEYTDGSDLDDSMAANPEEEIAR